MNKRFCGNPIPLSFRESTFQDRKDKSLLHGLLSYFLSDTSCRVVFLFYSISDFQSASLAIRTHCLPPWKQHFRLEIISGLEKIRFHFLCIKNKLFRTVDAIWDL